MILVLKEIILSQQIVVAVQKTINFIVVIALD